MKRLLLLTLLTFNLSLTCSDDTNAAYSVFAAVTNRMVKVIQQKRKLPLCSYHDGASADENQAVVNAMYLSLFFSDFETRVKLQIALTQVVAFAVFVQKSVGIEPFEKRKEDLKRCLALALNFEHDRVLAKADDSFEETCAKCILFSNYERDEGIIPIRNSDDYAAAEAIVTHIFKRADEQLAFLKHMSSRSPLSTEASDSSSR
jgi:hypothetical protein